MLNIETLIFELQKFSFFILSIKSLAIAMDTVTIKKMINQYRLLFISFTREKGIELAPFSDKKEKTNNIGCKTMSPPIKIEIHGLSSLLNMILNLS